MEENYDKAYWGSKKCPPVDCKKDACKCGLKKVFLPASLGDDSSNSPIAPKNGAYCNAIVVYEANDHVYIYSTEGVPTLINVEGEDAEEIIEELEKKLDKEILDRGAADDVLQQEIDDLKNSPDVVDIVATYAALQAYDTSKLGDNDIIRVLADETHDGQSTYYRWDKHNSVWIYIGAVGDYYTKGQVDTLLGGKQDKLTAGANINISAQNVISATDTTYSDFVGATIQQAGVAGLVPAPTTSDPDKYLKGDGSWSTPTGTTYTAGTNVQISSGNVISATDTTYSNFVGTDGQIAGTAGLVPAPATTDADKFLKSDGTWDTAGGGGGDTVYSDKNTSNSSTGGAVYIGNLDSNQEEQPDPTTTDNHYKYFWVLPNSNAQQPKDLSVNIMGYGTDQQGITIGPGANGSTNKYYSIIIGSNSISTKNATTVVGFGSHGDGENGVAIGRSANVNNDYSVALGTYSETSRKGEVNVGSGSVSFGYNNTSYRVIGGVHDGVDGHDAVTLNQLDGRVKQNAGAPTTSTVGTVGQLLEDTTNGKLYQCTAIDTTDPQNPSYTWTEVGAGGGGGGVTPVQTTGTSTTDVMSQDATTHMIYSSKNPSTYSGGGVVYIGNLDANQAQLQDPTTTAYSNYKYFWALPLSNSRVPSNNTVNILGDDGIGSSHSSIMLSGTIYGSQSVAIGYTSRADGQCVAVGYGSQAGNWTGRYGMTAIGAMAYAVDAEYSIHIGGNTGNGYGVRNSGSSASIAIGKNSQVGDANAVKNSVALGSYAKATRQGEVNVGLVNGEATGGYNSTAYRVIGGVHDGQLAQDAVTVNQVNSVIDAINTALSTNIPHIGA